MTQLCNDICRCAGYMCSRKLQCARHMDAPPPDAVYPKAQHLCAHEHKEYFIKWTS